MVPGARPTSEQTFRAQFFNAFHAKSPVPGAWPHPQCLPCQIHGSNAKSMDPIPGNGPGRAETLHRKKVTCVDMCSALVCTCVDASGPHGPFPHQNQPGCRRKNAPTMCPHWQWGEWAQEKTRITTTATITTLAIIPAATTITTVTTLSTAMEITAVTTLTDVFHSCRRHCTHCPSHGRPFPAMVGHGRQCAMASYSGRAIRNQAGFKTAGF